MKIKTVSGTPESFKDFFPPEELFHPDSFYDSEWTLGGGYDLDEPEVDMLVINAKEINGKNAYLEFLDKHYFKPLRSAIVSSIPIKNFYPKIALNVDYDKGERRVAFSYGQFVRQLMLSLINIKYAQEAFGEVKDDSYEYVINVARTFLRDELKRLNDVKEHLQASKYYRDAKENYDYFLKETQKYVSFPTFLQLKIDSTSSLIFSLKFCGNIFNKSLDEQALVDCFDYDKLCLMACYSALDACAFTEKTTNLVDGSATYVSKYLYVVDLYRKIEPNYNPFAIVIDHKTGKKKVIHIEDIKKAYDQLISRHPDYGVVMTDTHKIIMILKANGYTDEEIEAFDTSKKKDQETLEKLYEKFEADRELAANWEFMPKGEDEKEREPSSKPRHHLEGASAASTERARRLAIGWEYLAASNYLYHLSGINKFAGYHAYIYPTKKVVFEAMENDKSSFVPSTATYIMTLDNFIELSKLSKPEIIALMKGDSIGSTPINVRRLYHRENMERWKQDLARAISGQEYTHEVKTYIDALLSEEQLRRGGRQNVLS